MSSSDPNKRTSTVDTKESVDVNLVADMQESLDDVCSFTAYLVFQNGARVMIAHENMFIGRNPSCDIILQSSKISNYHACIHTGTSGLELIPLGRGTTLLNNRPLKTRRKLTNGDILEFYGKKATIHILGSESPPRVWWLHLQNLVIGIRKTITIGSGHNDSIYIPNLPISAFKLHPTQDALIAEVDHPVTLNQLFYSAGNTISIPGNTLLISGDFSCQLTVRVNPTTASTQVSEVISLPRQIVFQFLPTGGKLELIFSPEKKAVIKLAELRALLIGSLLCPAGGLKAGDFIPNDQLIRRIWPKNENKTRIHLNVLIHRTRKEFEKHGLNGMDFIQREGSNDATRFFLAPNTPTTIL